MFYYIHRTTTVNKKELTNEVYDAALVTTGVVGLSMASKKLLGEKLTDTTTVKGHSKVSSWSCG